jgi:hypothetical protein
MRVPRFLLSSAAFVCCLSLPAVAEPTNAELDLRLRAVENTLQTILELLQEEQTAASAVAEAQTGGIEETADTMPVGYRSGAMYIDVLSAPMTNDDVFRIVRGAPLPENPPSAPMASVIVPAPSSFDWGFVQTHDETSSFASAEGNLQVQWSGMLQVTSEGDHVFMVKLGRAEGGQGPEACRSVLRLNQKKMVDASWFGSEWRSFDVNAQGKEALAPGAYEFNLFLTCIGNRADAFKNTKVAVLLKAPNDRAPKPIPPERFGIRE